MFLALYSTAHYGESMHVDVEGIGMRKSGVSLKIRWVPVSWCSEFYIRDTSYYMYRLYTFTIHLERLECGL